MMQKNPGPACLTKRQIFGLSSRSDVYMVDASHILYQAGHCMVLLNIVNESQKFFNPNKALNNGKILCAKLSQNKRFLAIIEEKEIIIFSVETLRKRKTLPNSSHPFEVTKFISGCFHPQGNLITLSYHMESNEYHLTQWDWQECRPNIITCVNGFIENPKTFSGFISCFCSCDKHNMDICILAPEGFQVFTLSDKHFIPFNKDKFKLGEYENINPRPVWTAGKWIGEDLFLANQSGDLILFENYLFHSVILTPKVKKEGMGNSISCLEVITRNCIAVGLENGSIRILTRMDLSSASDGWQLWGETRINETHQNPIQSMAINFKQDELYVGSSQRIFSAKMYDFTKAKKKEQELTITEPFPNFHQGSVTGLDVCIQKQLVATCGLDGTIQIWDYKNMVPELKKKYEGVELYSLAFHPSGSYLLVGFPDRLRLLNVLLDDLRIQKEFSGIRNCKECKFAKGGHVFACVVHNDKIKIFNTWNTKLVHNLRSHTQAINSLCFTSDDKFLISSGSDGSVYQWSVATGDRIQEFSNRKYPIQSAISIMDNKLYAVGIKGGLREIVNNQLERSFELELGMTELVFGHDFSHNVLIAGTVNGLIRSITYPITVETGDYIGHEGHITRMCITHDDFYLFTSGVDGCVIMYEIKKKEGRLDSNKSEKNNKTNDFTKILVCQTDLQDLRSNNADLMERHEELHCQHEFHLRLKDVQLQEVLKEKNDEFESVSRIWDDKQAHMQNVLGDLELHFEEEIENEKQNNSKILAELEEKHQKSFLFEVQNYVALEKRKAINEREEKEGHILTQHKFKQDENLVSVENETNLCIKLEETKIKLEKLNRLNLQHKETKNQLFEDEDAEIQETINEYEELLLQEKKLGIQLKGENAVIKRKFCALQSEIDSMRQRAQEIQVFDSDRKACIDRRKMEIEKYNEDIERLDAVLVEKEKKICELKKKNQRLEKHKYVLDHKIKAAKAQIEPRDDKIMEMKKEIKSLDKELEKSHAIQKNLEKQIAKCKKGRLDETIQRKRKQWKIQHENRIMTDFSHDLTKLIKYIQIPDTLKKETKKLTGNYMDVVDNKFKQSFDDFSIEYKFQEQSLKRTIEEKQKMQNGEENQMCDKEFDIITENNSLIKQIDMLRNHLNQLKFEKHQKLISVHCSSDEDFEEILLDDIQMLPNF